MTIAGLDIGTTGCKCTVFSDKGKYLDRAYKDYPVTRNLSGHEVSAEAIMSGVWDVLAEASHKYPDIAAIGITSFGETFVMTDNKGNPLAPAMLYTDPRGSKECGELIEKVGSRQIAEITGLRPHEMYGLSKMMWICENAPDIWRSVAYIFEISDYVAFMLTGNRMVDYSLATRTMAFDVKSCGWSAVMLDAAGIDEALLSTPVPSGSCVGTLRAEAASKVGLSSKVEVVLAGHDQVAAAIGAGAFTPSVAVDGAGTVECITPVFDGRPNPAVMYDGYYCLVPYLEQDRYVTYAFSYTGGALVQWCADTLSKLEKELSRQTQQNINVFLEKKYLDKHEGKVPATGLLVLPHFAGAATPYMDTGSKGAILGLTLDTAVEDIYIACMEGIAYEMRLNMEKLGDAVKPVKKLNATGGGARSAVWMQMKADILNLPITALKTVDAGTVGCAMTAGVAVGVFKNLDEAAACMVEEEHTYEPSKAAHDDYTQMYEKYKQLYKAVRPLV